MTLVKSEAHLLSQHPPNTPQSRRRVPRTRRFPRSHARHSCGATPMQAHVGPLLMSTQHHHYKMPERGIYTVICASSRPVRWLFTWPKATTWARHEQDARNGSLVLQRVYICCLSQRAARGELLPTVATTRPVTLTFGAVDSTELRRAAGDCRAKRARSKSHLHLPRRAPTPPASTNTT